MNISSGAWIGGIAAVVIVAIAVVAAIVGRRLDINVMHDATCREVTIFTERVGGRWTGVLVSLGPIGIHLSWCDTTFPDA